MDQETVMEPRETTPIMASSGEAMLAPTEPAAEPPDSGRSLTAVGDREPEPPRAARLVSLDAFRGLAILGMLLVNNTALDNATPKHLTHAPWNGGIYFADLVFPWFLLIVGVAIPYAAASAKQKGVSRRQSALKTLGRAGALVVLGCLIDSSLARRPVVGLGVLQLIGLAYCAGAFLAALPLRPRLLVAAGLLAGHWAAIRFIPIPGFGAGVFTETANLVVYLNEAYLRGFGLKGLISVVPTTALVLIGATAGEALRSERLTPLRKAGLLAGSGAGLMLAGWLWSLDLPFNKPVWTASYILFTAGCGLLLLACLFLVIDFKGWRGWAFPLVVFGSNAILAYVVPIMTKVHVLQEWNWTMADGSTLPLQQALLSTSIQHFGRWGGGWAYTGGYILFWWLFLLLLYRRRLFLRV